LIEEGEHAQITEAIYTQGVLKPATSLNLREQQRVRVIVEPMEGALGDRDAALAQLKAGIASMQFFPNGPLPTRADLHDRI
jgi:predicted DNA-binding antitoxin AbrB/MazE fold protein